MSSDPLKDMEDAIEKAIKNSGKPDYLIFANKSTLRAYQKWVDPTRGMSKKEKKLYKLLYEDDDT